MEHRLHNCPKCKRQLNYANRLAGICPFCASHLGGKKPEEEPEIDWDTNAPKTKKTKEEDKTSFLCLAYVIGILVFLIGMYIFSRFNYLLGILNMFLGVLAIYAGAHRFVKQ